jgi:ankyrin repeat protein
MQSVERDKKRRGLKVIMKLRSHTISDWASALHLAAYCDRLGVVELLVEHGVALDPHVFHWAAEGDSKDGVEFPVQSGVNPDQVTDPFWRRGETAVHIAARRDNSAIAETLLNHHARTNIKARHPQTVLHRAGISVLTLLNSRGLVHSQLNNNGYSKMHQCIQYSYSEFACLLIDAGVDINTTNWEGKTPVQTAAEKGLSRVVEKLVEKGATRPS